MRKDNRALAITDPRVAVLASFATDQFSISVSDYQVGLRHDWHSHEKPVLTLLLAGHTRENVVNLDADPGRLDVGLKPDGIRHTDHFWPLDPESGFSINWGQGGAEHYPVGGAIGLNDTGTLLTVEVKLKPDWEYEFVLTGLAFKTKDGYPLQPYTVKFKTRKAAD